MPSSIPYDPSLALGAIVEPAAFAILKQIAELDAAIDAAQDNLNSFISMKRSIDMTLHELIDMEIDPSEIKAKSEELKKEISKAATEYAAIRLENEAKIRPLKAQVHSVHQGLESPVDYEKTAIKDFEISSDSLKMESQYFSFEQNDQGTANSMSGIKDLISGAASHLGPDAATDMATAGVSQVSKQLKEHKIVGTLVVTAACTHKKANLLTPVVIDVDKTIRIWNQVYPADKLRHGDPASMIAAASAEGDGKSDALNVLTGATYGSSFVGMVHVLRKDATDIGQAAGSGMSMTAIAESLQEKLKVAAWLEGESGGLGVDADLANDVKRLLGKQDFTSHVSVITMGVIPTIKSNELQFGVDKFAGFNADQMMKNLSTLAPSTPGASVAQTAEKSLEGKKLSALKNAQVESVMLGLDKIDEQKNSVIDVNSLVTAFDEYLDQIREEVGGVPVNYFVRPITKSEIAAMWLAKYRPDHALSTANAKTDDE